MPTAQLLGDHDSKARQRLRHSPWTRADCSIACFSLTGRASAWRMQATIRRHRCSGLQHAAYTIRRHRRSIMQQPSWPGKRISIGSRVNRTPQKWQCTQTLVGGGYRTMANQLGPKWLEGSAGYACPSPSTPSSPATSSSSIIIIISSNI